MQVLARTREDEASEDGSRWLGLPNGAVRLAAVAVGRAFWFSRVWQCG